MIKLVGTSHKLIDPGDIETVLAEEDYDHLFVEGITSDTKQRIEELINEEGMAPGGDSDEKYQYLSNKVNRSLEPEYIEKTPFLTDDQVTFLDDDPIKHLETILLSEEEKDSRKKGIDEENMLDKLIDGPPKREDYLDYFRHLRETDWYEFFSVSLSNPERLDSFIRLLGKDFVINEGEDTNKLYANYFVKKAKEYEIDRFDLQEVIYEGRKDFQDERDRRWYEKISEYKEENPEDDILVISGLNHFVDGEKSVRGLLENNHENVETAPFDHYV